MKNEKEQDYELNAPVFKLGVEENVFSKNLNQTDEIIGLHNIDVRNSNKYLENTYAKNKYDYDTTYNKMSYNQQDYISDLIADNKKELEYLELKQKERNLEIKNRQDNIKILQNQRKELKKQKLEREKLYSSLKKNDIGLTKICNTFSNNNLTPNLTFSKSEFEPLIKKKQAQQVNQYELDRIKNERRANLFYGEDDYDEAKEYFKNKKIEKEKLNTVENQLLKDYSPIFSKNTMFNTENLAEMDFEKSKKIGDEIREKDSSINSEEVKLFSELSHVVSSLEDFCFELKLELVNYFKSIDMDNDFVNAYIDNKLTNCIPILLFVKPFLIWWSTTSMLDKFYQREEISLSNSEEDLEIKNSMRHITGIARSTGSVSAFDAYVYGVAKEIYDLCLELYSQKFKIRKMVWEDTLTDLSNNKIGTSYVLEHPNATDEQIMNFAYEYSLQKRAEKR